MRSYEQLIEYIINDDQERAQELFHALVVEKSREIYNELVAEEMEHDMDEAMGDETDDMMGDIEADHDGLDTHDDDDMDMDDDDMDMDDDDMGMDHDDHAMHHEEGDIEDRVMDLEDALDELKAEFEALMADEHGEHDDMPEEGVMREYVEDMGHIYKQDMNAPKGRNAGADTGEHINTGESNTKSVVASKNDMGGTAKNLNQAEKGEDPDGKAYKEPSNQYTKGKSMVPGAGKFENVPGAKAGKAFSNAKKPVMSEPAGVNKKSEISGKAR
jgi:hypothetical protein